MMRVSSRLAFALLLAAVAAPHAKAAPIVAGQTVLPSVVFQDIALLPNTPFNPSPSPIIIGNLPAMGSLRLNRSAQVGDSIAIPSLDALYAGSHPFLGDFLFGSIPPLTAADSSGLITNVVQDPSDPGFAAGQPSSLRAGDLSIGGAGFGFEFLSGPAAGIQLYTDPAVPFSFSATLDGLPPSSGTALANSGPDVLNLLFNGQVVATSSNRHILITAVPEPSSIALCGVAGLCLVRRRRRLS